MVPCSLRTPLAYVLLGLLVSISPSVAHAGVILVCNQADNTRLFPGCSPSGSSCTVSADYSAPAGCDLDFGNRDVIFTGNFDVGSATLSVTARTITVASQLNARPADTTARGGKVVLTATGDGTPTHPGDIIIKSSHVDVTGNPAGFIQLTAAGKVDLQSTTPLVANGSQAFSSAGSILVAAGTSIRQAGLVSAATGSSADGGSVIYQAHTNIDILDDIDATGGANDGGDVEITAGDDINVGNPLSTGHTIDVSSLSGGNGGSISVRAGADAIGGIKPGGALKVTETLRADGNLDVESGYDGGDILLTALGPIVLSGPVHATGGVPDGSGGSLTIDASDGAPNRLGPLDGDVTVNAAVTLTCSGSFSDGGDVDIAAGRNATVSQGIDVTAASGGGISVIGGGNVTINAAVLANADVDTGDGGTINLRAGDASFGTLTVAARVDGHAGSTSGAADDHIYAGCNVSINANGSAPFALNANGSASFASARIDVAAPGTLSIGANTQLSALPNGNVVLTHAHTPTIGGGVGFAPTRTDVSATSSELYPACPVCGDGILQPGEVCEKAGPDGACCNDTCSALTCLTPTPTPTVTPTSTAVTPTRTATATRSPSPTRTVTATPIRTATPVVTTSGGGTPEPPTATPAGSTPATATATQAGSPSPTSTPLPLVQPKPVIACERALGRASTTLVAADIATIERCSLAAFACVQSKPAGSDRDACIATAHARCAKKLTALDKARNKFTTTLTSACGGEPPRVPFPLLLASSVLGFEKIDPTCRNEAHLSLTSLGAIAACVQFAGACRAEQALAVALPRIGDLLPTVLDVEEIGVCVPPPSGDLNGLADPKQGKLAVRCQQGATAAGRQLLMQRIATARGCVDGLLACRLAGRPLSACTKIAARCAKHLAILDQGPKSAVAKLAGSIGHACGSLPASALFGAAGTGFDGVADRCAALGVNPLGDVGAISSCVARAYGCAATALVRRVLPLVDDELARFGITLDDDPFCAEATPTPTATVTPTPTETPTLVATLSPTPTPMPVATDTATETPTPFDTGTPSETATPETAETPTPIDTAVPNPTATATPTGTCGNGIVEPGEECDFGDTAAGDGCSPDCLFELLVPGSGPVSVNCVSELGLIDPKATFGSDGVPTSLQSCVDGDPSCDADGIVNEECHFRVALCFRATDPRLARCAGADTVTKYTLHSPRPEDTVRNVTRATNAAALVAAFQALTPIPPGGDAGNVFTFDPPLVVSDVPLCTGVADFLVPLGSGDSHTEKIRGSTASTPEGNLVDRDKLRLRCIRP